MVRTSKATAIGLTAAILVFVAATAEAKDKVKVGFIGPLTGGVSVNGLGGRNSADLAVKLRNADAKAKYEYEFVVLDDECKPNVAVQVATKMAADKDIIAAATHYCSATAIAKVFPWAQYRTFADVGAAQGGLMSQVALAHPHLRGVGFDLPAVQPHFEQFIGRHGLSNRVNFQAGDFFADPLPSADVLVMGHVLHDWALDQKKILIEKAYATLPPGGALIIYETIIDDDRRRNVFGLLMSLNMLIETPGGADYTAAECEEWMQQAGFKMTRSGHLVGPESMVVGIK